MCPPDLNYDNCWSQRKSKVEGHKWDGTNNNNNNNNNNNSNEAFILSLLRCSRNGPLRVVRVFSFVVFVRCSTFLQVRILRSLKHPNVIDIYQFFQDDPKTYYVSIEYMRGGELFDRIVQKVTVSVKGNR